MNKYKYLLEYNIKLTVLKNNRIKSFSLRRRILVCKFGTIGILPFPMSKCSLQFVFFKYWTGLSEKLKILSKINRKSWHENQTKYETPVQKLLTLIKLNWLTSLILKNKRPIRFTVTQVLCNPYTNLLRSLICAFN